MRDAIDAEVYAARSRALHVTDIAWNDVPRHRLPVEAIRALRYMQAIRLAKASSRVCFHH